MSAAAARRASSGSARCNQKPDKDRLPVIQDKIANGLNAVNDKPTVYEKAADTKQGG